jgi:hypothetical protein
MASDSTISSNARRRSPTKTSSTSSRWKFSRPTNVLGTPKPFQVKKLLYAATTMGVSTSTVNNTSAGLRNAATVPQGRRRRGEAATGGGGTLGAGRRSSVITAGQPCLAAVVMAPATFSGDDLPASSSATLSLTC